MGSSAVGMFRSYRANGGDNQVRSNHVEADKALCGAEFASCRFLQWLEVDFGVGLPTRPIGVLLFPIDCVARSCVAQDVCVPGRPCCAVLLARSWWVGVLFFVGCSLLTAGARSCPAGDT